MTSESPEYNECGVKYHLHISFYKNRFFMQDDNLLKQAITAARAGHELTARDIFLQIVESEPRNELAWLWLVGLMDELDDCIYACEMVLDINPGNVNARQHQIYPYLLRNVTAKRPNHIWGIDITYIRLQQGWLYLTAVLDWYSRYVVSWALSQILEIEFVLTAVDNALFQAKPEICNSDQGSHFTSPKYLERLQHEEIKISMDGRGRAIDNIFTERLWRTIKYEEVHSHEYASPKEAYRQLADYIRFYNFERPHQALDYLTPAQVHGACTPHALVINSDGSSLSKLTLTNHTTLF
jgi:putative transposase